MYGMRSALVTEFLDLKLRIIYLVNHNNVVLFSACCTEERNVDSRSLFLFSSHCDTYN